MLADTAKRALEAYGGEERWRNARSIEVKFSAWGLAFWLKWQRPLDFVRAQVEINQPHVRLFPIDVRGHSGVLTGHDVHLENASGKIMRERKNARKFFPYGRRLFWWDALDQTYFCGYALWNYFTFPALLLREDISWREVSQNTLEAKFPPELPTHCPVQRFYFDSETHLLRQHDYTAEIFGPFAKAAHVIAKHSTWKGIPYTAKRIVTPRRKDGTPASFPVLVGIETHAWKLI